MCAHRCLRRVCTQVSASCVHTGACPFVSGNTHILRHGIIYFYVKIPRQKATNDIHSQCMKTASCTNV